MSSFEAPVYVFPGRPKASSRAESKGSVTVRISPFLSAESPRASASHSRFIKSVPPIFIVSEEYNSTGLSISGNSSYISDAGT